MCEQDAPGGKEGTAVWMQGSGEPRENEILFYTGAWSVRQNCKMGTAVEARLQNETGF